FRLEKERVGMTGLLRQRQSLTGPPVADAPGSPREAIGTGDVLSRHVAAAVDAAPGPDTHHIALADAPLDVDRDLRPALLAHGGLEHVLRDIVCQHPALHLGRRHDQSNAEQQGESYRSHTNL